MWNIIKDLFEYPIPPPHTARCSAEFDLLPPTLEKHVIFIRQEKYFEEPSFLTSALLQ